MTRLIFQTLRFRARISAKIINQITTLRLSRRKFFITIVLQMKSELRMSMVNKLRLESRRKNDYRSH